ncbi:MAG TPA: ABC transporter ATP-binding protein [Methylomirabilota bacterium]|nr:ABC transporter ATP-binding protein [Methylomirabilota bacterium]
MLEVERVNTFRGPAHVLRNLSLKVGDRESVCLVGRNGAGKTTTIDSVMGLLPIRSGRVAFGGRDVTRLPTHQRALAGMGYSPEDAGIFPDLTVAENFMISQSLARSAGKTAGPTSADHGIDERVLGVFPEIRSFTGRRGLYLSGGQKKMVAIARAMTLSPRILLLDEPFEGLAPVVVSRFIEAVKQIKAMGISLLIAESNLMTASRVADRLYAIDRGEIIFEGEPARAFEDPEVMKTLRG